MTLKLDWCSHEAAKWACEHWHYSRTMPSGKSVKVGVWEDSAFAGCVIFSQGACRNIGGPFGLIQEEVCELTRVALRKHNAAVSQIIARAVKMLRAQSRGLQLVVSMADPGQRHVGGIYQAANWLYLGEFRVLPKVVWNGQLVHNRSVRRIQFGRVTNRPGIRGLPTGPPESRHKYLLPLTRKLRRQLEPLAKPYPKREDAEEGSRATSRPSTRREGQGQFLHSAPVVTSQTAEA